MLWLEQMAWFSSYLYTPKGTYVKDIQMAPVVSALVAPCAGGKGGMRKASFGEDEEEWGRYDQCVGKILSADLHKRTEEINGMPARMY